MKNKLDKTTQVQQLDVFSATPLNLDPDYVSQPLSQRSIGFFGEHGFTTITNGRVRVPSV